MKRILLAICLSIFIFTTRVQAADVSVEWKGSLGATGYKIEVSEDLGATWTELTGLTYTTRTEGTLNLASATITVADNILVLARVGAFNNVGTSWKIESGAWFNSAWQPLPSPTGLGVD